MGLAEASPPSTISLIKIKAKLKPEARQKKRGGDNNLLCKMVW
jgi:hypothetical protein